MQEVELSPLCERVKKSVRTKYSEEYRGTSGSESKRIAELERSRKLFH